MSSPDRHLPVPDPAARPRPLAQRLQLLLLVLVLPVVAVTVPTLVVTCLFGQRPARKSAAYARPDVSGLTAALNHSAESLLPAPAPLTPETIRLTVRADHLRARADKVMSQAKSLGGSAVEGVSTAGEKHLYVDLPAGRGEAFRQAVTRNNPPVVPPANPLLGAARDQLEVLIRSAADDE